ncbi:MAG: hypothetical protein B0D96_12385 [Candidatus Sedimenticola endophacoides]|nr:MAG: hypothetical protein B0D94_02680 [Candidatus Sedimenticola endophacoides]OQX33020.1 MAG: hypothetical protein B0D96_12385 [Candidatus Sedimenticola endophacoides]OQX41227.1 MAG: hypothetical protein B0D88_07940 [Candidatus Sedimenticola endophacoides]OQX47892.1 MAG: hypothetical protein B0D87_08335 [Candidatus Sedimenticola endophacoides]
MSGVAMVEFAIVVPLILMLFLGITEMGHAFHQHNTLTKAVASGARYLARGYAILDAACATQGNWSAARATAENLLIHGNTAGSGSPLLPGLDDSGATDIQVTHPQFSDASGSGCVIRMTVDTDYTPIFPGLFVGDNSLLNLPTFRLSAASEERYIGE